MRSIFAALTLLCLPFASEACPDLAGKYLCNGSAQLGIEQAETDGVTTYTIVTGPYRDVLVADGTIITSKGTDGTVTKSMGRCVDDYFETMFDTDFPTEGYRSVMTTQWRRLDVDQVVLDFRSEEYFTGIDGPIINDSAMFCNRMAER